MRLHIDPLSKLYAEYLLKVGNGQESSIIDQFPPKAEAEPSVGVEIALYPQIHQAPSLDILIHAVFSTLAINYVNQGYMDDRAILTRKITVTLNIQIAEVVLRRKHVFLSVNLVEMGDD
jgi:hypothetical protein